MGKSFFLIMIFVLMNFMSLTAVVDAQGKETTGVRITPGAIILNEEVRRGIKYDLKHYLIENTGSSEAVITIKTTGSLKVSESEIRIPSGGSYSLRAWLDLKSSDELGDHKDSIVVTAKGDDPNNVASVEGWIQYEVLEANKFDLKFIAATTISILLVLLFIFKLTKVGKNRHEEN